MRALVVSSFVRLFCLFVCVFVCLCGVTHPRGSCAVAVSIRRGRPLAACLHFIRCVARVDLVSPSRHLFVVRSLVSFRIASRRIASHRVASQCHIRATTACAYPLPPPPSPLLIVCFLRWHSSAHTQPATLSPVPPLLLLLLLPQHHHYNCRIYRVCGCVSVAGSVVATSRFSFQLYSL